MKITFGNNGNLNFVGAFITSAERKIAVANFKPRSYAHQYALEYLKTCYIYQTDNLRDL